MVVLVGFGTVASAEPEFVRLSFPSARTDREIAITWNTASDVATRVEYGVSSGDLAQHQLGTSFAATGSELGFIHEVVLYDLEPDTIYYYRAGDPEDGFSPERQFTTGPAQHPECGQFRFLYVGDNRPDEIFGGGENYDVIMGQAMAHSPAFVLAGGDLVEDGMEPAQWRDFLGYTADVFDHVAFMPCIGNHDDGPGEGDEAYYNQIFALPRSGGSGASGTEDFYYFLFGNLIVVSLSTQTFKGGEIPFADQAAWLDEVLTDHPKRWKIVIFHHPSYTYGIFVDISSPPNEEEQNAALIPVLDEHHVDVVLTSHNHWYERYEPSACATQGDPGSDQPCSVGDSNYEQGTVYVVSGGAGAFTIPGALCGGPPGRARKPADGHGRASFLATVVGGRETRMTRASWSDGLHLSEARRAPLDRHRPALASFGPCGPV